jgi:hypothetical protein
MRDLQAKLTEISGSAAVGGIGVALNGLSTVTGKDTSAGHVYYGAVLAVETISTVMAAIWFLLRRRQVRD